jgi:HD-GYP domain-containing protein (c-di-GMP phosphodiesterase class II)
LHIGLPKPQLHILGSAGILLDVGMAQLPPEILDKKGSLSEPEYALMKTHVELGLAIIERSSGVSPQASQIVAQHHERENGSGYPAALAGRDISILGKMAAIVDCFVALISERHYARPVPPQEALQMLYNWSKEFFHADMVEQFIQCLGPYPVGSLVELNTGEVAVVLAHNRIRRLKPQVMVVLDAAKEPYSAPIHLDLINEPLAFDDQPYQIHSSLPDGMYQHNLKDFYL